MQVTQPDRVRVAHLISNLEIGGAEMMLYKLVAGMDRQRFSNMVISMLPPGPVAARIEAAGVPVHSLGMGRGAPNPMALIQLRNLLRKHGAQVMQTWMYHADLMGAVIAPLSGHIPVIWNIRQHALSGDLHRSRTRGIAKVCAWLSHRSPASIVSCSASALAWHRQLGYDATRMVCIPNGFDTDKLGPDANARSDVRKELGLPDTGIVIGMVARFHPQKNHEALIAAARPLCERFANLHFVLCGQGVDQENPKLQEWIGQTGYRDRFRLLGPRSDVPRIMTAFDVLAAPSHTEGFPNAVGEALTTAVPCVVTDVGDSAELVGDAGYIIPPGDDAALIGALDEIVGLPAEQRQAMGQNGRRRIIERYSLPSIIDRYSQLYTSVAAA